MELFQNKVVLAPMVRISTLPTRIIAREYGANLCFSPETVSYSIINSNLQHNSELDCWDLIQNKDKKSNLLFRTCKEDPDVIFQIAAPDAEKALKAAEVISPVVAAIDLNCGCPKKFSTKGEMGAALLKKPEVIADIISTLKRNINKPITCKIRILNTDKETVELVQMIEKAGANALTVHGRMVHERPREKAHWDRIKTVVENVQIPVIANGSVSSFDDIELIKNQTKASSVMIGKAAQDNVSVFRKEGLLNSYSVAKRYVQIAKKWNYPPKNVNFFLVKLFTNHSDSLKVNKIISQSKNLNDLFDYFNSQNDIIDNQEKIIRKREKNEENENNNENINIDENLEEKKRFKND
ncbi:tRNA-dihydrouridine(20) synthase [NADP(+)] [Anaeramoeba ignava]|uniref:tRNA-dihydrouridine(20) synthase [NADP(+)] n=1 Tax=Anaeramoeba ignava TaxID=1746090 RepID=A0A9Q0RFR7_ANAIG|nr:tRNA-dihydrouridine(20) synthase [NADP(+)] [Anaeramoeba ignava]